MVKIKGLILAAIVMLGVAGFTQAAPLKVCCTVPDLGYLVREIGTDHVRVVVFAKGPEDAHFIEAKPSFVKELSEADLFVQMGLELELGWAPVLLRGCHNSKVQPSARGFLDCSKAIQPIDVPTVAVDRSQGDVHPQGNPHYLLDPVNGLRVARLIRDKLSELDPSHKQQFARQYEQFHKKLAAALVGEKLAAAYDIEKLMIAQDRGQLLNYLKQQNQLDQLGGWLGSVKDLQGTKIVVDHNMWNYFARRFGLQVVAAMEPKPGLPPTTGHLKGVVEQMKQQQVRVVVTSPYFNPRHAEFLAQNTGAKVSLLAHQTEATQGAGDYFALFESNIRSLTAALGGR